MTNSKRIRFSYLWLLPQNRSSLLSPYSPHSSSRKSGTKIIRNARRSYYVRAAVLAAERLALIQRRPVLAAVTLSFSRRILVVACSLVRRRRHVFGRLTRLDGERSIGLDLVAKTAARLSILRLFHCRRFHLIFISPSK